MVIRQKLDHPLKVGEGMMIEFGNLGLDGKLIARYHQPSLEQSFDDPRVSAIEPLDPHPMFWPPDSTLDAFARRVRYE